LAGLIWEDFKAELGEVDVTLLVTRSGSARFLRKEQEIQKETCV
jgi:hypothetical protein